METKNKLVTLGELKERLGDVGYKIVEELPKEGLPDIMYITQTDVRSGVEVYDKWIYSDKKWIKISTGTIRHFLISDWESATSDFVTKKTISELLNKKQDVIEDLDEIRSGSNLAIRELSAITIDEVINMLK